MGIVVAPANRHDSTLLLKTIESIPIKIPKASKRCRHHLCLDKAYDAEWIRNRLQSIGFTPHIPFREFSNRPKIKKIKGKRYKPKR